ncbi:MAG: peptidase M15, partial [Francisellaceae bacterium]|nr:peptidase M15 [Francisellaceae bacterium]
MIKRIILLVSLFFSFQCLALLPNGFVYLNDIDSSIQVDLRYAGQDNFLGRKVNQYNSKKLAILTEEAALALKKAQEIF